MLLGDRLKELRVSRNLAVSQVAEMLGVSPSTYREWEYGREIKGEPYMKLASIFNIGLNELLTGRRNHVEYELIKLEECIKNIRSFL